MVIDTSAIFAAIAGEIDSGVYRRAIISTRVRLISAVTLLETHIVLVSRRGGGSISILHELIERAGIVVVPFDEPLAEAAFEAFKQYGKGRSQSPAQHNRLRRLRACQDARPPAAVQGQRLRRNRYTAGAFFPRVRPCDLAGDRNDDGATRAFRFLRPLKGPLVDLKLREEQKGGQPPTPLTPAPSISSGQARSARGCAGGGGAGAPWSSRNGGVRVRAFDNSSYCITNAKACRSLA
jgi:uncharacterized protein with PIN domain